MKRICLFLVSSFLMLGYQNSFANPEDISEITEVLNKIEVKQLNSDEKFSLDQYKNKLILIDFWATWCKPCIESLPHLNELQKTFPQQLKVIAISDENKTTVNKFLKDKNYKFTIVLDNNDISNNNFPHEYIPYSMLILPNGEIIDDLYQSQLTKEFIREIIDKHKIK
ncbi:MAG: TlpA family protein disulfide reductase [Candidatus Sericytochromatia bacterium]